MALHPKFQKKAQEEIERELGKKALPTFADRQRLPYIDCIIKELLRWRPPVPCSEFSSSNFYKIQILISIEVVRATLTDDIIDGVHVSAGATIGINTWYNFATIDDICGDVADCHIGLLPVILSYTIDLKGSIPIVSSARKTKRRWTLGDTRLGITDGMSTKYVLPVIILICFVSEFVQEWTMSMLPDIS